MPRGQGVSVATAEKRKRWATGGYIERHRKQLGLSYEEVGEMLGVHPITVRNWEKQPSIKPMVKLAFDAAFMRRRPKRIIKSRAKLETWHRFYRTEKCILKDNPHVVPSECLFP